MIEVSPKGVDPKEYNSQEEYRKAWLDVFMDEILLECYEGLL